MTLFSDVFKDTDISRYYTFPVRNPSLKRQIEWRKILVIWGKNSQFIQKFTIWNLFFFDKIHIFKVSFFTKFTISKVSFFTFTFFKHQIIVNLWINKPVKKSIIFWRKESARINEVTYLAIDHFWKEALFELKNQEIIVVHLRPHLTQELIRKWFVNKRYIPWHLLTTVRDIFLRFQKRSLFWSLCGLYSGNPGHGVQRN